MKNCYCMGAVSKIHPESLNPKAYTNPEPPQPKPCINPKTLNLGPNLT